MDSKNLVDIVGTPFSVGDTVATDTLAYRTSNLRVGKVSAFDGEHVRVPYPDGGKKKDGSAAVRSVWRRPQGVVKVSA